MKEKVWDSSVLKALVDASGLGYNGVADLCNIRHATFCGYVGGYCAPSLNKLVALADLFGVTLDELVGRDQEQNTVQKVNKEYASLVAAMAEKVGEGKVKPEKFRRNDIPWPYNLLREIFGSWEAPLADYQMEGLEFALSSLRERHRDVVEQCFKEGRTLSEIGQNFGVSRERVRQIIARAVRTMKHPVNSSAILYGMENAGKRRELTRMEVVLNEQEKRVSAMEKALRKRKIKAENGLRELTTVGVEEGDISVLHLSTRANNALRRGYREGATLVSVDTVEKLIACASTGKLWAVRNLGVKTIAEICAALRNYAGVDYSDIYDVVSAQN